MRQSNRTRVWVVSSCLGLAVIMIFGAFCIALGILLYNVRRPNLPTAPATQALTIPTAHQALFPNIIFGRGFDSENCAVSQVLKTISQEELIDSEQFYLVVPFQQDTVGEIIEIVWTAPSGETSISRKTLSADLRFCFAQPSNLSYKLPAGAYELEVKHKGQVVFTQPLQIEQSDLSNYPRPKREPFGNFTVGQLGIANNICQVSKPAKIVTQAELIQSPWFYFVSSFTMDEIGKPFYWTVYGPNNSIVYDRTERVLDDDIYLCLWQGFQVGKVGVGDYKLVIEYEEKVIYETIIEVK